MNHNDEMYEAAITYSLRTVGKVIIALFLIAAGLALFLATAKAASPFAIDFTKQLVGFDGKPVGGLDCTGVKIPGKDCSIMTLGEAVLFAFKVPIDADRATDFAAKFKNGQLAASVYDNKAAILSSEQISAIKDRLGKVFGADVAYAAGPLLDPSLRH